MKNHKNTSGITLIALIITIIVLLILAAVAIATLTGDNGLIKKAGEAKNTLNEAEEKEQIQLGYNGYKMAKYTEANPQLKVEGATVTGEGPWTIAFSSGNSYTLSAEGRIIEGSSTGGEQSSITPISKVETENFVGYYADINADGTVDGVIFADLLVGNTKYGEWTDEDGTYTIPKLSASELKDYYVSKEKHTWGEIEKPVLSPTGNGKERFYVMAFSDLDTNTHYWYINARRNMSDYETATSEDFGKGKKNTEDMIARWKKGAVSNGGYGDKNDNDMWGLIGTQVEAGWFIPSRAEWSAFGGELEIDDTYSSPYGSLLSSNYWTSSQSSTESAYTAVFGNDIAYMGGTSVNASYYVRLATTF